MTTVKYSDLLMDWLKEFGYTHCFFVGGGNVMHLLESASKRFVCIAVVHEVAAGIAAEYFNESHEGKQKAFALVTAGPGLTNVVTAIGGAWLENRELLIIGGQAKVSDLVRNGSRQIGHQEINGIAITSGITKESLQLTKPATKSEIYNFCSESWMGKKGPVFLEICIDVSATPADVHKLSSNIEIKSRQSLPKITIEKEQELINLILKSKRPVFLFGGGLSREITNKLLVDIESMELPVATTYNGADRESYEYKYYCGRPNWYGMRWANILLQQADLVIAFGSRLGIQQVGFSWDEFAPLAKVVQIDIDEAELDKGFPKVDLKLPYDADDILEKIVLNKEISNQTDWRDWKNFIIKIRKIFEKVDPENKVEAGYLELQKFLWDLGDYLNSDDIIVPCSSGGSYTGTLQMFKNKHGQQMITDKSLASMGYGLSGAIGASFANPGKRIIHIEGDGGFAQNLQEIGTVAINKLNIKMFIAENRGYASIRTTQKAYFNGNYVGCDEFTGLGLPDWELIFKAYGINSLRMTPENYFDSEVLEALNSDEPYAFIVTLDPDQLYFPKLTSRVMPDGSMKSNPLHLMSPKLSEDECKEAFPYLPSEYLV